MIVIGSRDPRTLSAFIIFPMIVLNNLSNGSGIAGSLSPAYSGERIPMTSILADRLQTAKPFPRCSRLYCTFQHFHLHLDTLCVSN